MKPLFWPTPPPCSLLCLSSAPCINELPLVTWRSLFWWSWCECTSTLVLGWWSTAHPLLPNPPPPLPAVPLVHVTCLQRRYHNISYTVWYKYPPWTLIHILSIFWICFQIRRVLKIKVLLPAALCSGESNLSAAWCNSESNLTDCMMQQGVKSYRCMMQLGVNLAAVS
jgi:hypothetical protein